MPKINQIISDMVNARKEDAVIIYHLHDNFNLTLIQAREKLAEAKVWMGWYARKDVKDLVS